MGKLLVPLICKAKLHGANMKPPYNVHETLVHVSISPSV